MIADTTVLYHGNCPDGFGAAVACWQHLGLKAEYIPVSYGQPLPHIPADHTHVFIVDFSYDENTLTRLHMQHGRVSVFDHHASAESELSPLCTPAYVAQGLRVLFDMQESGATLTWKALREEGDNLKCESLERAMPRLFHYIRDRDLWRFHLPQSHAVALALRAEEKSLAGWAELARQLEEDSFFAQFAKQGEAILRYSQQLVDEQALRWRMGTIGGYQVPIVNSTTLFSEVGDFLCQLSKDGVPGPTFVAYYYDRSDGKRQWGLRSRDAKIDVSIIAKKYGGGGHPGAAGFVTERTWEGDGEASRPWTIMHYSS